MCRRLKLVTTITARKPRHDMVDALSLLLRYPQQVPKAPQNTEHVHCGHHKHTAAFQFRRSVQARMNKPVQKHRTIQQIVANFCRCRRAAESGIGAPVSGSLCPSFRCRSFRTGHHTSIHQVVPPAHPVKKVSAATLRLTGQLGGWGVSVCLALNAPPKLLLLVMGSWTGSCAGPGLLPHQCLQ